MTDQTRFASSLHFVTGSRRLALAALCCMLVGTAASARAQEPSDYDRTVERAVSEFNLGNSEEAHALFRHAHELSPNARSWRGLGVCAFELRHYVEAVADLEAALLDPRKPLTPEQRDEAKRLLVQAREFVSAYHLRVRPPNAQVLVDGRPAAMKNDILQLNPGPHTVVVRAAGYEERRAEFRAGAGVSEELSIELSVHERADRESSAQPAMPSGPTGAAHSRRRRIWTWSLAGGAVAAAAVAVGLRMRVNGVHRDYHACVAAGADCEAVKHNGQRLQHTSYALSAVATAFMVGAGVAYALEGREKPQPSVSLQLSPAGLQLSGSF